MDVAEAGSLEGDDGPSLKVRRGGSAALEPLWTSACLRCFSLT